MVAIDVPIIQAFESCLQPIRVDGEVRYRTYRCPAAVLTIGWGTTRSDVPTLAEGDIWTRAKCDEVFDRSLAAYSNIVRRATVGRVTPLADHQFGALRSLVYNCGPGALAGSVGRAVREGRDDDVPELMARWNKGGGKVLAGLVRRRKAEGLLYRGRISEAYRIAEATPPGSMPQSRETPKPTVRELARRTPGLAAATAGGGGTATGTATTSPATKVDDWSTAEIVLVVGGIVVAVIAGLVMLRKWRKLAETWA